MANIKGLNEETFSFSESFQKQIIIAMIQKPTLFERVGVLVDYNCFELKKYKDIYKTLKSYFSEYRVIPTEDNFINEIRKINDTEDVIETVKKLYSSDKLNDCNIQYIEDEVKEFVSYQALKKAIVDSIDDLNDTDKHSAIKERVEDAINIRAKMEDNGVDCYSDEAIIDRWAKRQNKEDIKVLSTGWSTLDKILGGGFEEKTITSFMGVANSGKSQYLVNVGANLLTQGYNIVYITLEMSEEIVSNRFDARLLGLTHSEIKSADSNTVIKLKELMEQRIGKLFIKQYPALTATVDDINAYIEKIENLYKIKIDALIVDYADIMCSTKHYEQRRFELESIYIQLRNVAIQRNMPVITATQLSRAAVKASKEGKTLDSEFIAESFSIQMNLDTALTINCTAADTANKTQMLYVSKNRNGEAGLQIRMYVDFSKSLIKEWSAEQAIRDGSDVIKTENKTVSNNIAEEKQKKFNMMVKK